MPEALSFLKAVSDPTRLHVLVLLKERPCCVCELMSAVGGEQSLVSHHMRVLRGAGVVEAERRGRWIFYHLSPGFEGRVRLLLDDVLAGLPEGDDRQCRVIDLSHRAGSRERSATAAESAELPGAQDDRGRVTQDSRRCGQGANRSCPVRRPSRAELTAGRPRRQRYKSAAGRPPAGGKRGASR